ATNHGYPARDTVTALLQPFPGPMQFQLINSPQQHTVVVISIICINSSLGRCLLSQWQRHQCQSGTRTRKPVCQPHCLASVDCYQCRCAPEFSSTAITHSAP